MAKNVSVMPAEATLNRRSRNRRRSSRSCSSGRQLLARSGDDHRPDWDARWSAAEDHYFGTVMTPDRFDLVLAG